MPIHCSWGVQILSMASLCGWFWLNLEFHMQGHQMVGAVEGSTASTGCLFLWRHSRCFCQVTWLYADGAPAESRFGMDCRRVKLAFFASRKGRPLSDAQKWFNRLAAEHMPDLGAFVSLWLVLSCNAKNSEDWSSTCKFSTGFLSACVKAKKTQVIAWGFSCVLGPADFGKLLNGCVGCVRATSSWTQGILDLKSFLSWNNLDTVNLAYPKKGTL